MTVHYVPTGHVGPYIAPDGYEYLWVEDSPNLTELMVPDGYDGLWVYRCPGLTHISLPESCVYLSSLRDPNLSIDYRGSENDI